ncbi:MAG: hypothetical protein HOV81_22130 [Kofleriaceae bacterium]|nr:hypothetical protein [Kofleriaceae bacterium]
MRTPGVVALAVVLAACNDHAANLTGDAAVDATIDATVDAPTCMDPYEAQDPYDTGVAMMRSSAILPGAMICPAGDQDRFLVALTQPSNIEMVIEFAASDPPVEGSILNNNLTPIMNASPVTAAPQRRRAYVPNQPSGNYYVEAYAAPGAVSHYTLTINVTAP